MTTIEELHRSIKYLIGRDKTVDTWIGSLRSTTNDLNRKVQYLTDSDDTVAALISELYEMGAITTGNVNVVSTKLNDTDKKLEHLTARFNQLTAVNRPLKYIIGVHRTDIVRLINKVSAAEDRADVAMDHVEMLESKMEKLERTVKVQQKDIQLLMQIAVYARYAKQDADSVTNDLQDRIMELERETA